MPHCENTTCNKKLSPEETREDRGKVVCESCFGVTPLHAAPQQEPRQVLDRDFNYDFGYTRQRGIYANVSLGGAKLSLEVSQEELTRTFGPPKS